MDSVGRSFRALLLLGFAMCTGCKAERPPHSLADLTERIEASGAIVFRTDIDIDAHKLFDVYGQLFDLPPDTTMSLVEDSVDQAGESQLRFQQFHRGIEVEGADIRVRAHNNRALSAIGQLAHRFAPTESTPQLSEERAWEIVQTYVTPDRPVLAANSDRPHGSLVFTALPQSEERVLAWRFDARIEPKEKSRRVYVDAMHGAIVKEAALKA